jgi:signal transduction histidine kinase
MRFAFCFFLVLFGILKISAQAFETGELESNVLLQKGVYFLEDKNKSSSFKEILSSKEFKPVASETPNFGMSDSDFWLKIVLKNTSNAPSLRLQVAQPSLDEIDFYHLQKNGALEVQFGGEVAPFYSRHYFDPSYIYRIEIAPNQTEVYYLRVHSRDNLQVPIIVGRPESILQSNKVKDFVFGLFAGIMLVMFLYNAFLFVTVRDKTYFYYILYLGTVILTQLSIQGYTFQYLWPNSSFLAQWSPFLFSPAVGIASAYFLRVFLNTKQFTPKLDKGFIYFSVLYAVAVLCALVGKYSLSYLIITLCATVLSMYMLVTAAVIFKMDYKPARYFLVAWSMFLVGVTIYAMTNLGLLPTSSFTQYAMPVGAAAEVVLLSLALADRINVLKREKEQSQAEALRVSQQNQKLVSEQNVILEQKVHERTIELEETNEELNITLTYLKDTQTQLVNAEKMASLGQLTAGIAHEINNPINFVSANLKPLRMDISEVFELVSKFEELKFDDTLAEKLKEVELFKNRIDLPYLQKEIGSLLSGIEDGATRTAEIVSGLRNFSRLDESDIKEANVNEGIESTLVLLRSQLQDIEIVKSLGELPMIECFPGKLNQVFMNILGNGIYAVNKKEINAQKRLTIKTFMRDEKVVIMFEDNGIGMSQEVKEKIFEPFFTTKDVGEGTGLGMSIVFKIIESHHAKMEVESEPGVGTKITLILNQKVN